MIKVLIVEDSVVSRQLLHYILTSDPEIMVVGMVKDGEEAVKMAPQLKPDVITMDIYMPKMDGYQATRHIMETHPVPIIIVTASWKPDDVSLAFKTMEAGALTAIEKPVGVSNANYETLAQELIKTVKLMSEIKVIKRRAKADQPPAAAPMLTSTKTDFKLLAIGISTGGPPLLQNILTGLPQNFPIPIVIVQHIAPGFLNGLVDWLAQTSPLAVHIATQAELILPSHVYFAPDNQHMGVTSIGQITLSQSEPEHNLRPSVAHLFRSVAQAYGAKSIGLLLTGMGKDGAAELRLMREHGATTIAQDKESAIVHGMPGEAIKLGAAMHILPASKIVATLVGLVKK